jgi:hypothetical protein
MPAYTQEQIESRMSDENLSRVSRILCEDMDASSILTHKAALIETVVVSVNPDTKYGESLRVIDID